MKPVQPPKVEYEVISVAIAQLKPHPQQASIFGQRDEREIQKLAEDMRINGQQNPIDIVPDGTIVCGHCRVEAAKLLGWDTIDARVRVDLAERGDDAIEEWLVTDNYLRRQQNPLQMACCFRAIYEKRYAAYKKDRSNRSPGDFRDVLAKEFDIKGRTLSRYLAILNTPEEVQWAWSEGSLSLVQAEQVAHLARANQEAIAAELRAGSNPKEVVTRYLPKKQRKRGDVLLGLVKYLKNCVPALQGGDLSFELTDADTGPLVEGKELLEEVIRQRQRYEDTPWRELDQIRADRAAEGLSIDPKDPDYQKAITEPRAKLGF